MMLTFHYAAVHSHIVAMCTCSCAWSYPTNPSPFKLLAQWDWEGTVPLILKETMIRHILGGKASSLNCIVLYTFQFPMFRTCAMFHTWAWGSMLTSGLLDATGYLIHFNLDFQHSSRAEFEFPWWVIYTRNLLLLLDVSSVFCIEYWSQALDRGSL